MAQYKIVCITTKPKYAETTVVQLFEAATRNQAFERFSKEWSNRTGDGSLFLVRIDSLKEIACASSTLRKA